MLTRPTVRVRHWTASYDDPPGTPPHLVSDYEMGIAETVEKVDARLRELGLEHSPRWSQIKETLNADPS
jgi:hypothetical protein